MINNKNTIMYNTCCNTAFQYLVLQTAEHLIESWQVFTSFWHGWLILINVRIYVPVCFWGCNWNQSFLSMHKLHSPDWYFPTVKYGLKGHLLTHLEETTVLKLQQINVWKSIFHMFWSSNHLSWGNSSAIRFLRMLPI